MSTPANVPAALETRIQMTAPTRTAALREACTATGRPSSAAPNLQNIPLCTADGLRIRRAYALARVGGAR